MWVTISLSLVNERVFLFGVQHLLGSDQSFCVVGTSERSSYKEYV